MENLFEQTMKENFLNLLKELDIQVQEAQRVPKKLGPNGNTPRLHIIIKLPKIKDKERIFKAARKKELLTKEFPLEYQLIYHIKRNLTGKKGLENSIQSHEKLGPISKIILPNKAVI